MVRYLLSLVFAIAALALSAPGFAVIEINQFSNEQIRDRYNGLIDELRCPKCQNQNLAGSDSVVAVDLRREVLFMLEDGYTDVEIRTFMRERYGDFILYNPPVEGKTLLVWLLPVVFVCVALLILITVLRSSTKNTQLGIDDGMDPDTDL